MAELLGRSVVITSTRTTKLELSDKIGIGDKHNSENEVLEMVFHFSQERIIY